MTRVSKDEWAMQLAAVTASRATCLRRSVGCVLTNERGHVLATGYNGVASGLPHCNHAQSKTNPNLWVVPEDDSPAYFRKPEHWEREVVSVYPHACSGAHAPSGQGLDGCQAIHAEQNALLQCRDVYSIHTCYVTASPCVTCVKLLMNTGCRRIVFSEEYPHAESRRLWMTNPSREWVQL
jgi:dCMP deaminase